MSVGKIAIRYAKALFEAAQEGNKLETVRNDLMGFLDLDQSLPEFRDLLESPVLSAAQKKEILSILFAEKVEDLSMRFVVLLTENKREVYLPSVCRVFMDMYKAMQGVKSAVVTTAGQLETGTVEAVRKSLEDYYKCKIELETSIKPELIGGFVLRVEDQQLDTSVASQLRKIRQGLDHIVIS